MVDLDKTPCQDQYVNHHTNGLAVVGLCPCHPALHDLPITKIEFSIRNRNLKGNRVHGRKKKGGHQVYPETILCFLYTASGARYRIFAGAWAHLLELNPRVLADPNLLAREPLTDGYLAILNPRSKSIRDRAGKLLLTGEQYDAVRAAREAPIGAPAKAPRAGGETPEAMAIETPGEAREREEKEEERKRRRTHSPEKYPGE
eukprot:gnl/Trimastix_PCT/504.p1 GENE.gnl/Trimastix_PCT/504~~gnl/Trimastix_PCT/504.p1  ORF type:complete len:235 (-),score=54.95 gnl/Trimastix_PCT/504:576-1181(-)